MIIERINGIILKPRRGDILIYLKSPYPNKKKGDRKVENTGFEPVTYCMPCKRSTN